MQKTKNSYPSTWLVLTKIWLIIFLIGSLPLLAQVPTAGLIGGWTFSGNANDMTASANHGTVFGAALTTDRCGNSNSAYNFNGTNSYILMQAAGPTGTLSRSVSFWARTNNTLINSPRSSFDYGSSSTSGGSAFEICWNYCALGVGVDNSINAMIKSTSCLYNGAWHHIVAIMNSTISTQVGAVQFYIDGVLQAPIVCFVTGTTSPVNTTNFSPVTIGKAAGFNSRYFQGDLDDFYLYDRVLTPAEVLQLYNTCPPVISGAPLVCTPTGNTYSVLPISGATYTWSLPTGWTGSSTTNTISVSNITTAGTLSVAITPTCGPPTLSTLSISPATGSAVIASSNPTICAGSSTTLSVTGGTSFTWQPSGSTTASIVVSPSITTTYSVSSSAGSCAYTNTFVQNVSVPAITVAVSGSLACQGHLATLTATGAANYTWQPGNFTASFAVVSPTANTIYTVNSLNASGCSASGTVQVVVPPALTQSVSASSATACAGGLLTFSANATGGTGALSYSWTGGPSTQTYATTNFPGSFVYTITAKDANSCTVTNTVSGTYFTQVALSAPGVSVCPGASGVFTVAGANTYSWMPSGTTGSTYISTSTVSTQFTVIGIAANGCSASATPSLTVRVQPTLSYTTSAISCSVLGAATVAASGVGPYVYAWLPVTQTTNFATGIYPGTYTISTTNVSTGCTYTSTTSFTTSSALGGTVSGSPSVACNGAGTATAAITISGGSASQSYTWVSTAGQLVQPTVAALPAGIHTVYVSDNLTYCQLTRTFSITQPSAINVNILAATSSVCIGGILNFTTSASGGTGAFTYSWQPGTASSAISIQHTLAGNYVYTASVTDANNCGASATIQAAFVPNPTITVASVSACPLQVTQLYASGATTYSWNNGSQANPLVLSSASPLQFTVSGSQAGCSSQATASLFIKPVPTVTFTHNAPLCQGDTLKLYGMDDVLTYTWTGPAAFFSFLKDPVIPNTSLSKAGNYFLKVTANNSCTGTATQPIVVHPLPTISISGATVCQGSSFTLASIASPSCNYFWLGPGSFTSGLSQPVVSAAQPAMSGTYSLTLTSSASCVNSAIANVSVVALVNPAAFAGGPVCAGATLSLSVTAGITHVWSGPLGFSSTNQYPVINSVPVSAAGIYTVQAFTGPCVEMRTVQVVVNALPSPTLSSNSPLCRFQNLQLMCQGGTAYVLSGPSGFNSTQSVVTIFSVQPVNAGTYSVLATNQAGCMASTTVPVQVLELPVVHAIGDTVCAGEAAQLSAEGGTLYNWTGPFSFNQQGSLQNFSVATLGNSGSYSVSITGTNGCVSYTQVVLRVNPFDLPVPVIEAPKDVCINQKIKLQASGGVSYLWNGPMLNNYTKPVLDLEINSLVQAGVYSLSVINASNCSASTTVEVRVHPLPQAALLPDYLEGCAPLCTGFRLIRLSSTTPIEAGTYNINGKEYKPPLGTFCFLKEGVQQATVFYADSNACANNTSVKLQVFPKPLAAFYTTPQLLIENTETVNFVNSSQSQGRTTWSWHFLHSPHDSIKTKHTNWFFKEAGSYPVALVVRNEFGCMDTVMHTVKVEPEFLFYIPDSFTPNGDGLNDIFRPEVRGILTLEMQVFDRWGELIYESNELSAGWDGRRNSEICKTDTYVWKIRLKTISGKTLNKTGKIYLLR